MQESLFSRQHLLHSMKDPTVRLLAAHVVAHNDKVDVVFRLEGGLEMLSVSQ